MYIYKTTNLLNGKVYIGKAENQPDNYLGSGKILKRAIKKYGIDSFSREIIEYCKSRNALNEREIYWIEKFNSTNPNIGYNITKGGTGGNTYENLSEAQMDEIKKKISDAMTNREFTEEHKKSLSESAKSRKGNKPNPLKGKSYDDYMPLEKAQEVKNKIRNSLRGNTLSEETKKRIRLNNPKSKPVTIDGKTYISISEARKETGLSYNKVKQYQNGK